MKGTRHNAKKEELLCDSFVFRSGRAQSLMLREFFREKFKYTLNSEIGKAVNKILRCQAGDRNEKAKTKLKVQ